MPFTPEQLAKIHQKEASLPDAMRRDPNVNYYEGWFFVTLKTRDAVPVLSVCTGDPNIPDGQPGAPQCLYTQVGKGVKAVWASIPSFHPGVILDIAEFMPDHMHGLLYLRPGNREHLGHIIKGFMIGCSHAYWDTLGINWRKNHPTGGHKTTRYQGVATPEYVDQDHTRSFRGPALFVRGYNDTEPITPEQVEIKRAYIRDQARKRIIQGGHHACFFKYRHQHSRNWTLERAMTAISTDRTFCHNPERCASAQKQVTARLNTDDRGICLDYIGNKQLLYAQRKLPLICHRADAARFEEQKTAVLTAAREGAIIVSAFISPKERDIKNQLMTELLPFIEITDNGFSDKYKGIGMSFYALAENRLLQITHWNYLYEKDGTQVSREMCMIMNEMARVISGEKDDWWKG